MEPHQRQTASPDERLCISTCPSRAATRRNAGREQAFQQIEAPRGSTQTARPRRAPSGVDPSQSQSRRNPLLHRQLLQHDRQRSAARQPQRSHAATGNDLSSPRTPLGSCGAGIPARCCCFCRCSSSWSLPVELALSPSARLGIGSDRSLSRSFGINTLRATAARSLKNKELQVKVFINQ